MDDPIRLLSSRQVHKGRLVTLREDTVILPRGTETVYEYVEIKAGASTLAIADNGDVWLVREWKYALGQPTIEVISGGIEAGETPEETAHRELREEAGLIARELIPMGRVDPFTTMLRCANHLFIARGISEVPHEREEGEVMDTLRVPLSEAVRMVMDGEITHGSSCVLILKAAQWLT
jgi:8-oxo-dGTP pyrophosphatase MutT (NUDIX family)